MAPKIYLCRQGQGGGRAWTWIGVDDVRRYPAKCERVALAQSRLTARNQISAPAGRRRRLGVGPGSALEWDEVDGNIAVRRRPGEYTGVDVDRAGFPEGPPKRHSLKELKRGIEEYNTEKHARR